jgi:hypothetical protein
MEYELSSEDQTTLEALLATMDTSISEYFAILKKLKSPYAQANPDLTDDANTSIASGITEGVAELHLLEDVERAYVKRLKDMDVITNPEKAEHINGQIRIARGAIAHAKSLL